MFLALGLASPAASGSFPPRKAVWGIDVSHHQGVIDWDALRGQGLSFAYIKATEGSRRVDHAFSENWQGAARAGLARGAYHFYNFCEPAAPQAAEFIKLVPKAAGSLPPALDLETSDSCRVLPSPKSLRRELAVFSRKLEARYGKVPVLYVSHKIYDLYLKDRKHGFKIWISDYRGMPVLSDRKPWTFWQCSASAQLRGIKGAVDVDLFSGSAQQFAFLGKPLPALLAQQSRSRR